MAGVFSTDRCEWCGQRFSNAVDDPCGVCPDCARRTYGPYDLYR